MYLQGARQPRAAGGARPTAASSYKYETPEYRQALEFTAKLYKDGLVHPDLVASKGARREAAVRERQDPLHAGRPRRLAGHAGASSQKVTPGFNMQPVPVFSATGGDPLVWGADEPDLLHLHQEGPGQGAGRGAAAACSTGAPRRSAPRSSSCASTAWRASTSPGAPTARRSRPTWLKEIAEPVLLHQRPLAGRCSRRPETPNYVKDMLGVRQRHGEVPREGPVGRASSSRCRRSYSAVNHADRGQDHRHRPRPAPGHDLDGVVEEWRTGGGDEGRDFLAKALADAGR